MKNFVKKSGQFIYTCGGVVTAGDVVVSGKYRGIAITSGVSGDEIAVQTEGIFELTKKAPLVITQGDKLYWDSDPGEVTKTVTDVPIGIAAQSELSAAVTVQVDLGGESEAVGVAANVAALTDNSGGEVADGTIAVITVAAALTDNSGGSAADGTIGAITLTEPANLAAQTVINDQIADAIAELAAAANAHRLAIIACKNAVAELAAKMNAEIAALKAAGLQATA